MLNWCGPCVELRGSVWNLGELASKQEFRLEKYVLIFEILVGDRYFESKNSFESKFNVKKIEKIQTWYFELI